ncbi:hypothetical protein LY474_25800 [Myxococcus stipitatus]|uniref:hypothetical protein n=1 Tax=Myxococcus stipitatus TaxID=83455 RepID=UPI001F47ACDA|nr:hypothetical protein [Myxococcus stipitatus]MCE9671229.1 hypothetical protein [Myxococcus stipitatus]
MSFPEFQRYLASGYVSRKTGAPLGPEAASDYASRLRRLEAVTGWKVEGASPGVLLAWVDRIRDDRALAEKLGPGGDRDVQVALRRYADYLSRPSTHGAVVSGADLGELHAADGRLLAASPPAAPATESPDAPMMAELRDGRRRSPTPRSFDPTQSVAPFVPSEEREDPAETLTRREKATQGHRTLLIALHRHLLGAGWIELQEITTSVDLWATNPVDGRRVIFEAKTLDASTEVKQTRYALSQLLEYRHFDGSSEDRLCLVTNAPISDAREQFLRTQGVAVLVLDGEGIHAVGPLAQEWFGSLIGSAATAAPNRRGGVER